MNKQTSKWAVLIAILVVSSASAVWAQAPADKTASGVPANPGAAAQAAPLSDCLPDSTLIYVGWSGKTGLMDQSLLGQLLAEPALAQIVNAIEAAAIKEMHSEDDTKTLKDALALGDIVWRHPLAVALLDLKFGNGDPQPSLAVLIDLGKDRKAFDEKLKALVAKLPVQSKQAKVGEVTYEALPGPDGIEIAYGYVGDKFFLTLGEGTAKQIIELVGSPKTEKRLAGKLTRLYATTKTDMSKVQLALYADTTTLMDRFDALITAMGEQPAGTPSEFRRVMDALGLSGVTAIHGALEFRDKGSYTWLRIQAPAPQRGILAPFAGAPLKDADLAGIPEDAEFACVLRLDAKILLDELKGIVAKIEPRDSKDIDRGLQEIDKEIGVSLEKDILANLGDTWVVSSASSQGGFLTGTVASVKLKDPEKFKVVVNSLEYFARNKMSAANDDSGGSSRGPFGSMRVKISSARYGNLEVHYLNISPMCFAPAWAIHKDRLYVALWPQVISMAIDNPRKSSILKSPAFVKARAKVAANASMIAYADTARLIRQLYGAGLPLWSLATGALEGETGVDISPAAFPTLDKIEKYLLPQIQAVSSDKDGILLEAYGSLPLPTAGLVTAAPAVIGGAAMVGIYVGSRFAALQEALPAPTEVLEPPVALPPDED